MTIEVRQMLIRSLITESPDPAPALPRAASAELERLREQVLKECKAWLAEQLRGKNER
ncbi:MAG: DUF5908 family protein [Rubrivivax sp.]|nr:DUF5908 family protein [Rubrivivax sp.]